MNRDTSINIRILSETELHDALPLIWEVFFEYEAPQYTGSGKQSFWNAIHDESYLSQLSAFGAFNGDMLVGIIATRNVGQHLALFFVRGAYHRKGIGRVLWNTVLAESTASVIAVHSSHYAAPIYEKLGFVQTGEAKTEDGIFYIPMEYSRENNR